MALKLNERYPGRFDNPTPGYPQGSFKNRTSPDAKDGSYLERDWANDKEGFFQSLLEMSGIEADGEVDAVGSSQYFTALLDAIRTLKSVQRFTTSGTFIVPDGVTQVWVSGCAGGGGGGSSLATNASSFVTGGSGGGAGQSVLRVPISVTPGQVIPLTIGGGGVGGGAALNNATAGGATQLGAAGALLNLVGGLQGLLGVGGTTVPGNYGGPAGGVGFPNGGFAQDTAAYAGGVASGGFGGVGGSTPFGNAGAPGRGASGSSPPPTPGFGFGAGGSGAGGAYNSTISAPGGAGAAGMPGLLIIEW